MKRKRKQQPPSETASPQMPVAAPMEKPKPKNHPLAIAAGLVAAVIAFFAARYTYDALVHPRRDAEVPAALKTNAWVEQRIPGSELVLELPWALDQVPMDLPPQLAQFLIVKASLQHEEDGLVIMVSLMEMRAGEPDLEGAVDGAINNMRTVPGTRSVTPTKRETTLLGLRAFDVEARVERDNAPPLVARSILFVENRCLYQIALLTEAEQKDGAAIWDRVRAGIRKPGG